MPLSASGISWAKRPARKPQRIIHAFGVKWTAELDLAFDVCNPPLAHTYAGRNAGRFAERKIAELQHRQPVDLADFATLSANQNDLAVNASPERDRAAGRSVAYVRR